MDAQRQVNAPCFGLDASLGHNPFISGGSQLLHPQVNTSVLDFSQSVTLEPLISGDSHMSSLDENQSLFSAGIAGTTLAPLAVGNPVEHQSSHSNGQDPFRPDIPGAGKMPHGVGCSTAYQNSPGNGHGSFNAGIPGGVHGVSYPAEQKIAMPTDYSMLMKQPSPASSPAALAAAASSRLNGGAVWHATSPSSEHKRKADGSHSMETPTKRRQSANKQDICVSGSHRTPEQDFYTSCQSSGSTLYGISPPSANASTYSTSVKAGVCAVVRLLINEVKKCGTALSLVLADGPGTDFGSPESGDRIKQMAKSHLVAVNAMDIESDQEAFVNGAYKTL